MRQECYFTSLYFSGKEVKVRDEKGSCCLKKVLKNSPKKACHFVMAHDMLND